MKSILLLSLLVYITIASLLSSTTNSFLLSPSFHRHHHTAPSSSTQLSSKSAFTPPSTPLNPQPFISPPPPQSPSSKPLQTLAFITSNTLKLTEAQSILTPLTPSHITIQTIDLDLSEIQGTPDDIAKEKCLLAIRMVNSYGERGVSKVFVEDTSLSLSALNGLPGPYVKSFMSAIGKEGLVRMIDNFESKECYAETIISYADSNTVLLSDVKLFKGRTYGKLVKPRGYSNSTGFDSIFECSEGEGEGGTNGKTYAEMSKEEKNSVSHRGKAFRELGEWLMSGFI